MNLKKYIKKVVDFPKKGVVFRDITSLLEDGKAFNYVIKTFIKYTKKQNPDVIVAPESRGFIFASPIASHLALPFVIVRQSHKLPRPTIQVNCKSEYEDITLFIHKDAIKPGQKVLIVDDVLATGGTIKSSVDLIEKLGGIVIGYVFLIWIKNLKGEKQLKNYPFYSLIDY